MLFGFVCPHASFTVDRSWTFYKFQDFFHKPSKLWIFHLYGNVSINDDFLESKPSLETPLTVTAFFYCLMFKIFIHWKEGEGGGAEIGGILDFIYPDSWCQQLWTFIKKKQPAGVLLSISRFPKIYIAALVNVQYTAILVTPLPPPELQSLNLCPVGNEFDNLRTIQH